MDQQYRQQSQPSPSQPLPQTQPPQSQWVPAPMFAPGPTNMGYFTSTIQAGGPLPPTPVTHPLNLPWKPFSQALNLTHHLDIHPSIETLKTLGVAEIEKAQNEC